MSHPFIVGETYRNRHGEYEVLELDGPRMVIRYLDGRQIETTVKLQARIWKHIQAEERVQKRRRERASSTPSVRGGTGLPKRLFEQNLEDVFIAYSFVYVDEAVTALADASPRVEALVGQPYFGSRIVSARDAMVLYRHLTNGDDIPVLFTPQTRHQEQRFEYGSRLLDLLHEEEIDRVRRNVDDGKWLLWDKSLYAKNFLIVRTPIVELADKPPLEAATNLLRGPTQGQPTKAVSIPAPKLLDPDFRHVLDAL